MRLCGMIPSGEGIFDLALGRYYRWFAPPVSGDILNVVGEADRYILPREKI